MLAHLHVVTLCADEGNFPSAGSCPLSGVGSLFSLVVSRMWRYPCPR